MKNRLVHFTTWRSDHYMRKLDRYATWGALNMRDEGKRPGVLRMFAHFPLRFLQLYVFRLGFLDGIPGFQLCMLLSFYGLLKQFRLWEQYHALEQPDPEASNASADDDSSARSRPSQVVAMPFDPPLMAAGTAAPTAVLGHRPA